MRYGADQGEAEGHIGIPGRDKIGGDERGKAGQIGPLF